MTEVHGGKSWVVGCWELALEKKRVQKLDHMEKWPRNGKGVPETGTPDLALLLLFHK